MMSEVMCGSDNIIHAPILDHKCKQFIYFFNHANDHCGLQLDDYKECFWNELGVHLPDRSKCGAVCSDSHGHLPHEIDVCHQQCVHVHDCVDVCKTDEYKFRDTIKECFETCMKRSPVSPVGTCQGSCGGHSPNMKCHCDPTCSYTNDCCDDYENYCLVAGMRWNESLPLPNKTFTLPGFNVSSEDVENFEEKHSPHAVEVNVKEEINRRAKTKLANEKQKVYAEKQAKQRRSREEAFMKAQIAHGGQKTADGGMR